MRRSLVTFLVAMLLLGLGISAGQAAFAQTSTVTVTGILNIVYGDPITVYTLTDPQDPGKRTRLLIDDKTWQSSGIAVSELNRTLVTVSGVAVGAGLQSAAISASTLAVAAIKPAGASAAAAPPLPASGAQAYVNLLCKFNDITTEQHPSSWYDTLTGIGGNGTSVPSLDNYFRDSSYGNITLAGSLSSGYWRFLPHPLSYYGDGTNSNANIGTNLYNMAQDCANAWSPYITFAPFIGINFVFNGEVFATAWGGSTTLTLNGTTRTVGTTWYNVTYGEYLAVWQHELGHALGLAHSGSDLNGTQYADAYDVMAWPYYAAPAGQPYVYWGQHNIGYAKDKLGWIPAARKFTYNGTPTTITLGELGSSAGSNYLLAQIPYPGGPATHFYTAEFRAKTGSYENRLPLAATGAVIIHEVDTTRSVPAWVQGDGTASSGGATLAAAYQWTAGRTWSGPGGIQIDVQYTTTSSASISIGAPPWRVSLSADRTLVGSADLVTLTATANHNVDGTPYFITIWDTTQGLGSSELTSCSTGTTCAISVNATGPATRNYTAYVAGSNSTNVQAQSGTPSVRWLGSFTVSLAANPTSAAANQNVALTATGNQSVSGTNYFIEIWDTTAVLPNRLLACGSGTTCATTVTSVNETRSYTAYIQQSDGSGRQAQSSAVSVTWAASSLRPTVTGVAPNSGPTGGGTTVTITGTNFATAPGATTVQFNIATATAPGGGALTCTATQCVVASPAGRAGTTDVSINTAAGGYSAASSADQFTYLACTPAKADITSPSGGSITTGTPTFQWGGGGCVTQYYLYVGSTAGQADYYNSGALASTVTAATVSPAMPLDGRTIYVRLWSLVNGTFQEVDHAYLMGACNNPNGADITSPSGGSVTSGTPTFRWGGGVCATQYYLYVGSQFGQADLFAAGPLASSTTQATVSPAIPVDGRTIYVRLWSLVNGSFQSVDHSYLMGACNNGAKAEITAPTGGSITTGTPTFQWGGGVCVTQYYLYVGSQSGQADLFAAGPLAGSVSSATVSPAIPVDGRTIYVRLWSLVNGSYQPVDHSYLMGACSNGARAAIGSPAAGTTLHGSSQSFGWSGGQCVTQYYLYAGSSYGTADLLAAGPLAGTVTSQTMTNLPANSSMVYLRLWSLVGGTWLMSEQSYSSAP